MPTYLSARAVGAMARDMDARLYDAARHVFMATATNGVACGSTCADFKLGYVLRYGKLAANQANLAIMAKWHKAPDSRPDWYKAADNAARSALIRLLAALELQSPSKQGGKRGARTPKADISDADTSDAAAPKVDAPKADAPKADAPKADAPKADAPKADAPAAPTLTIPKVTNAKGWDSLLRDMAAYLLQAAAISPKKPTAAQMAAIRALAPKAD
jgi:hypothetical protein